MIAHPVCQRRSEQPSGCGWRGANAPDARPEMAQEAEHRQSVDIVDVARCPAPI